MFKVPFPKNGKTSIICMHSCDKLGNLLWNCSPYSILARRRRVRVNKSMQKYDDGFRSEALPPRVLRHIFKFALTSLTLYGALVFFKDMLLIWLFSFFKFARTHSMFQGLTVSGSQPWTRPATTRGQVHYRVSHNPCLIKHCKLYADRQEIWWDSIYIYLDVKHIYNRPLFPSSHFNCVNHSYRICLID